MVEESIATDVFCRHSHLFLPLLDRVSWNRLCSTNSQIYNCSRYLTPPWPQKRLRMASRVKSVAFSPDGEYLACGSADTMVRIWNKRNGSCTLLKGHTESVECVSFSPNGKMLASGSGRWSIRLWKLQDQSHTLLEGHNAGFISAIAFSPSGLSLASGSWDCGEVRLWDTHDGRCTRTVTTRRLGHFWSVAFSPDGATLVGDGASIFLWDPEAEGDGSSPSSIIDTNNRQHAFCLVHAPNGMFLASAVGFDVKTWRASGDGSLLEMDPRGRQHASVDFSPNGKLVASDDYNKDGIVRLWTVNDPRGTNCLVASPYAHRYEKDEDGEEVPARVNSVAFTNDGQNLASGGNDGILFLWDTRKFL
jgi:WD40 repeat protein